jgi:hypothetical protein
VTTGLCFVTLVAESAMIWLTTNDPWTLGPGDALILVYMLGPVVVLTVIAWGTRNSRNNAWGLSLVILVILGWGLRTMAEHTYHFRTDPDYRKLQAIGVFAVPLGQWLASGSLGAGIVFARCREAKEDKQNTS